MKIYTKTGDKGKTSLLGGVKVPKYDSRIEAYGTIDELNAQIGTLRAGLNHANYKYLITVQNELFTLGSLLASTPKARQNMSLPKLSEESISGLENEIDQMTNELSELKSFILPGRTVQDGQCHIARCVCRRAERRVVELRDIKENSVDDIMVKYLNRLSDYLFVLARKISFDQGHSDLEWLP